MPCFIFTSCHVELCKIEGQTTVRLWLRCDQSARQFAVGRTTVFTFPLPLGDPGEGGMVPWAQPSSYPKRHLDWFIHYRTAHADAQTVEHR